MSEDTVKGAAAGPGPGPGGGPGGPSAAEEASDAGGGDGMGEGLSHLLPFLMALMGDGATRRPGTGTALRMQLAFWALDSAADYHKSMQGVLERARDRLRTLDLGPDRAGGAGEGGGEGDAEW